MLQAMKQRFQSKSRFIFSLKNSICPKLDGRANIMVITKFNNICKTDQMC
jgi:hypothetical protein